MASQSRTQRTVLLVVGCVLLLALWWWANHDSATGEAGGSTPDRTSSVAASGPGGPSPTPPSGRSRTTPADTSGLPHVSPADLPAEARHTLELIAAGGPFPYDRDGVVFQNRERILPRKSGGYYHEYTVPTPGEDDRGARRIITGKQGERYWTADHYASFAWIAP